MLEDRSIHRAARCLVLSQVLIPALQERGVPAERIQHIPHGEFRYYQRFATQLNPESSPTKPRLLFFGQITAYKGIKILLDAFERINPRHQVWLQIVGSGDINPYLSKIRGLPNVELVNRWIAEQEIPLYFQHAPIVVLPYTSASQSGIIPLAASFACPVIATRVGGIPEQISHRQTGLLIEPGSIDKLVEAIECLLDDPKLQCSLGESLRSEYESHRTWDQIATQVYQACNISISNR
jgi:glycosyltransferase involved in cell wall biosynthesis